MKVAEVVDVQEKMLTWCAGTDTLSVVALLQETVDTTDGELETRLRRARLGLACVRRRLSARLGLAATLARHCELFEVVEVVVVE